jgi:hypothetical protein
LIFYITPAPFFNHNSFSLPTKILVPLIQKYNQLVIPTSPEFRFEIGLGSHDIAGLADGTIEQFRLLTVIRADQIIDGSGIVVGNHGTGTTIQSDLNLQNEGTPRQSVWNY